MKWQEYLEDKNRLFWFVHTIGWLGFALVHYLGSLLHDMRDIFTFIILLNTYAGWLISIPLRYIYHRVWKLSPLKIVMTILLSSYITGVIWQVIKNLNHWEIYQHGFKPEFWLYYTSDSVWSFYIMLCWSGLYFGIKYYQMLQQERQKVLKANTMAHQAQLKMLRYQLNPHFLFNTLNAISTLVLTQENKTANGMVTRLSDFLRYTLETDPMKQVSLAQELHALTLYLDIEEVRFGERLRVHVDINPDCEQALVPSMILQPIVENAIKYAIATSEQGGSITLKASRFGHDLLLEVKDDGPGAEIVNGNLYRENGVGLANTRERLSALFDGNYALVVTKNNPSGIVVNIRMPFKLDKS